MTTNKVLCIFHKDCADGLGAAFAVNCALGEEVEFVAAQYGDDPKIVESDADYRKRLQEREPNWQSIQTQTGVDLDEIGAGFECGRAHRFRGRDVLIVDFSYPLATLRAMAAEARSVLVLDHHRTAQGDLADLPQPVLSGIPNDPSPRTPWECWLEYGAVNHLGDVLSWPEGKDFPRLAAIFDVERSGAGITWDYLHQQPALSETAQQKLAAAAAQGFYGVLDPTIPQPVPRPRIIDLIEDRDLWKFRFGDESRAFHAVLMSHWDGDLLKMFRCLDDWNSQLNSLASGTGTNLELAGYHLLNEGHAILRAQAQLVAAAVRATRRTMRIAGHVVPVANVPHALASEAGQLLYSNEGCEGLKYTGLRQSRLPDFSATYYDGADGRRHFSLRSSDGGVDVGEVAKMFGGGGHQHVAGFDAIISWEGE